MPLPKPSTDQSQKDFISSCMGNAVMVKEYSDQKQRAAVCFTQWKQAKKNKDEGKASVIDFDENNDLGPFLIIH